ncbi:MAG: sec-independent protein secretion pathway component TatC, partial [Phenylobacterium sp.]|nr:sec-independent protein secretion pathway component TatC [Phenylobacterium sp.]
MSDAHDEEIEASRAPLLDHLIELRKRLIVCVAAVAVGFAVCFTFSQQLYIFLTHPFDVASQLVAFRQQHAHSHPASPGVVGAALDGLAGARDLFLTLLGLRDAPVIAGAQKVSLISTAPLEFFFTKLKLSGFGAVVLTFPVLAWQVYAFVAPGLYKKERRAFLPFLLAAPALFLMGAALVYYMILPFVLWFSLNQQILGGPVVVQLLPKVSEYLSLVTTLLMAFGL